MYRICDVGVNNEMKDNIGSHLIGLPFLSILSFVVLFFLSFHVDLIYMEEVQCDIHQNGSLFLMEELDV